MKILDIFMTYLSCAFKSLTSSDSAIFVSLVRCAGSRCSVFINSFLTSFSRFISFSFFKVGEVNVRESGVFLLPSPSPTSIVSTSSSAPDSLFIVTPLSSFIYKSKSTINSEIINSKQNFILIIEQ